MPSLSFYGAAVAAAGLSAFWFDSQQRYTSAYLFTSDPDTCIAALWGLLAGSSTYWMWTALTRFPAHPTLKQAVPNCNPIKRFLLQNVADIVDNGLYRFCLDSGLASDLTFCLFGRSPKILVAGPEDANYIFTAEDEFNKGKTPEIFSRIIGKDSLGTAPNDVHRIHRRVMGPAFSPKALRHLANVCVPEHTARAVTELQTQISRSAVENGTPESTTRDTMQEWLDELTFDIIVQAAFKFEGTDAEVKEVRRSVESGFKNSFSPARMSPFLDSLMLWSNRIVARERNGILQLLFKMMKKIKNESSESTKEERGDALIDYLVHSEQLSDIAVADNSIIFLFAGFETTSTALNWALYVLATHPEVQAKLHEEVSSAFALGKTATMDDIQHCSYLGYFCKELLRVHSPASLATRTATRDTVLPSQTFVAKGTEMWVCLTPLLKNPKYWGADANEFKPERWEGEGFDSKVKHAYIPFISGRRNCIGKDFAMNEMQLILAMMVRSFEFRWPEGEPEPVPFVKITNRPSKPFKVTLVNRTQ